MRVETVKEVETVRTNQTNDIVDFSNEESVRNWNRTRNRLASLVPRSN
jgi:hypothetical protein